MIERIKQVIAEAVEDSYDIKLEPQVSIPEEQFGDVASNVAMQLAKQLDSNPRDIAQKLSDELVKKPEIVEATIAGPGFLNVRVADDVTVYAVAQPIETSLHDKSYVVEYSDPNPFKVLHAGHLYTSIVGDAISNLYEVRGATVHRVNFGGDVGLHVAKCMWGIITFLEGEHPDKLAEVADSIRADWLSARYVEGNTAYEDDDIAKEQIIAYNKMIYEVWSENDTESPFAQIYRTCRDWSYSYFDTFYESIGTTFEKYYPESVTAPVGLEAVNRELKNGVYEESNGAIVFDGEKHGLHTRVFINSKGLPTYETKDVGLALCKWADYEFDASIMITGNDIKEYMKVVLKSIEQFEPEIAARSKHITHGILKLQGGVKMSSRLGNFLKATDVLDAAREASSQSDESQVLAAVKYSLLKQAIGPDVIYDPEESIAMEGNSGPYLQYAHARAASISRKATNESKQPASLDENEKLFAKKLALFSSALLEASDTQSPHKLCLYLYELAQAFNRFYEKSRVIGSDREQERLWLLENYKKTLAIGLDTLGIDAPESM